MKQTTNYGFNKPELQDSPPDITVLNPNFDKIDAQLKSLTDKDIELNSTINQVKTDYLPKTGGNVTNGLTVKNKTVAVSVNGSTADANGNIEIDVGGDVQSVNGIQPDENGNVVLDLGGDVQSVDGIEPDENGNVQLNALTQDEVLEATERVTDVEVDVSVATHEALQTAVARVEANLDSKLSLSGGTMTGAISFSNGSKIEHFNGNYNGIDIRASQEITDGAFLGLYAKDSQQSKGAFSLCAVDESARCDLSGFPNGQLLWDGKNVICVESWSNGTAFYRKYSDGWIEQGGFFESPYEEGGANFLVPFKDTNYKVLVELRTAGSDVNYNPAVIGKTTTNFSYTSMLHKGFGADWYACGY